MCGWPWRGILFFCASSDPCANRQLPFCALFWCAIPSVFMLKRNVGHFLRKWDRTKSEVPYKLMQLTISTQLRVFVTMERCYIRSMESSCQITKKWWEEKENDCKSPKASEFEAQLAAVIFTRRGVAETEYFRYRNRTRHKYVAWIANEKMEEKNNCAILKIWPLFFIRSPSLQ